MRLGQGQNSRAASGWGKGISSKVLGGFGEGGLA